MSPSTTTSPNNINKSNDDDDNDKAFYRAFGLVVATLSVGIVVLGLLVSSSGPRVRHVVEQSIRANGGIPGGGINQEGLSVVFDRPIESTTSDFQSAIE